MDAIIAVLVIFGVAVLLAWGIGKLTRIEFSDSGTGLKERKNHGHPKSD